MGFTPVFVAMRHVTRSCSFERRLVTNPDWSDHWRKSVHADGLTDMLHFDYLVFFPCLIWYRSLTDGKLSGGCDLRNQICKSLALARNFVSCHIVQLVSLPSPNHWKINMLVHD